MTFIHSGDAGDVIYALPCIRAAIKRSSPPLDAASLILGTKRGTLHPFTESWAANLTPLIQAQPYISDCWRQKPGDTWTFDLDPFVSLLFKRYQRGKRITSYVCDLLGLPYNCADEPWLTVDTPTHVPGCPVVVNLTTRYRNKWFPWSKVYHNYQGQMVFIGLDSEHSEFERHVGSIPYCRTENALEMAQLIAGCKLFIGNQSLAYAIAEGMKKPTVLETSADFPNCIWTRGNAVFFVRGHELRLPKLERLK